MDHNSPPLGRSHQNSQVKSAVASVVAHYHYRDFRIYCTVPLPRCPISLPVLEYENVVGAKPGVTRSATRSATVGSKQPESRLVKLFRLFGLLCLGDTLTRRKRRERRDDREKVYFFITNKAIQKKTAFTLDQYEMPIPPGPPTVEYAMST